jgi:hypothetical protein
VSELFDESPRKPRRPTNPPRRSRALLITAGLVVVGFIALTGIASFWTERLWFDSIGYSSVFSKLVWTRIWLFFGFGGLMAVAVGLNMLLAYRFRPLFRPASAEQTSLDRYREAVSPIRRWIWLAVALLMGAFAGTSAAGEWRDYLLWRHGVPFGRQDPYFHRDIGFYVFDLPWWHYLVDFTMAAAVISLLAAALVHYLYGGLRLQGTRDRLSGAAAAQLSTLVGIFVLAKAGDYWLDRFDILTGSGRLIDGMTYTDDHAVLPAKNILLGIAVICALLFFLNVWRRTWLLPTVGLGLYVLSAILLGMIWPGIVQQFQVNPSEADKEASYISRNIEATRTAFGLENVTVESYPNTSAGQSVAQITAETASVPLVDPKIIRQTFEQKQQVTGYYSVAPVLDVDRYPIKDTERALVLGVRELDQTGLAESSKNWSNLHTVYTHGYGVIATYGNQRDINERPIAGQEDESSATAQDAQWAEYDLPPRGALTDESSDGYEGRIYFGEQSPDYSIVGKTDSGPSVEFDRPLSEGSDQGSTTTYDGKAGVSIGGFGRQLLYALKFGEPNIVLSSRVNENSKIIYDRDPAERVEKVAPWLSIDGDPYPAVVDGRVQWIVDGYTTTDKYPQSERESFDEMTTDSLTSDSQFQALPTDEINYMRNAVKATVDAYDGTVTLYAWDETDPLLKAWESAFPGTVQPKSAISPDLMAHLRYPEDMFKAQRFQFARYHVTDASDFYEGNDRWVVPQDPYAQTQLQPPYRMFVDMPGSDGASYSMTSVYVPNKRENLAAFMAVNSDATSPDYGTIRALRSSAQNVPGPGQVSNAFSNDSDVRDALFKFQSQSGTQVVYGNLLTLPVNGQLMYVQPIYVLRTGQEAAYPIFNSVIVSLGASQRVGFGDTLPAAIADLLGAAPSQEPGTPTNNPSGNLSAEVRRLLNQAEAAFRAADAAQRANDTEEWARQLAIGRAKLSEAVRLANQPPADDGKPGASPSSTATP